MKKIYLLLTSLAVVTSGAFAQNLRFATKKSFATPIVNLGSAVSLQFDQGNQRKADAAIALPALKLSATQHAAKSNGGLDTLDSHFTGTPTIYTVTGGGYVAGHNSYGDLAKMQKFDATYGVANTGIITEIILAIGAKVDDSTSSIAVNIWDDNNGEPGNIIGTATLPIADIDTSAANGFLTTVSFANPVAIPANKIFYAGIGLSYADTGMVGLITTTNGDFPDAITHSWEEWSDTTYWNLADSWGLNIAYGIFPVVELDSIIPPPPPPLPANVFYHEDFNNGMPANMTILDLDGQTVASGIAQYFPTAWAALDLTTDPTDLSAVSTSWYTPAGTADDWMITDSIIIPDSASNVFLSWDAASLDADFPDGYEVYISNTTKDTAGLMANPMLFSTMAEDAGEFVKRSVDVSAYAGDTIFIAFRNNSTDMFILAIDNIKVAIPSPYDVAVTAANVDGDASFLAQYTSVPARQVPNTAADLKVTVANNGTNAVDTAYLVAMIADGANIIFADTLEMIGTFPAPGNTLEVTMNKSFSLPTSIGLHNLGLAAEVKILSEEDDTLNNFIVGVIASYTVSDSVYARDDNAAGTASLSIGGGLTGHLGMVFDIKERDTLSSVEVVLKQEKAGRNIAVSVWEFDGTTPATAPLINSRTYEASLPGTYNVIISGGIDLTSGQYIVSIDELDSAVTVGVSTNIYTPGTVWVQSPGIGTGAWYPVEAFGQATFLKPFFVRPIFSEVVVLGVNNTKALNADVNVYPNPANEKLNVSINGNSQGQYQIQVMDIFGRVINQHSNMPLGTFELNVSNLEAGVYVIRVSDGSASESIKFIKQ